MDQLTLENFRCFREEQTARLAPLTLLVGENSTGKTSFMALIRALWDVACHRVPDFKEDPYDLGSFDEVAHHRGGRGSRADSFQAGFNFTHRNPADPIMEARPYRFEVTFRKKGTVPIPVRRRISDFGQDVWIEECLGKCQRSLLRFGTSNGTWQKPSTLVRIGMVAEDDWMSSFSFSLKNLQQRLREGREKGLESITSNGPARPTEEDWKLIEQIVACEPGDFYRYVPRPFASAPVRSKPLRTYDPWHSTRDPGGDYIPTYLANLYFQDKAKWNALKNALEKFGKDAGLFDEISVRQLGKNESEPFQIQVRKFGSRRKGPQRNLIDVGYGVSQVLPVITELLRRDAPPMFLLQQPEVHLHPSAQAALGSLFCQVAKPERQLIVETHSDHLLDRVRMDVRDAETKLKPEDVSILFFERGDLDVRIHSLRFDEEGNVLDVPPSYRRFFMEETRRSLWKR